MNMATEKLNWIKIDMSDELVAEAFAEAKVAYHKHAELKAFAEQLVLDKACKAGLPDTHTLKYGYLYGPPAFAIVEAKEQKAKKPAKGAMTPEQLGAQFKSVTTLIKK